VPHPSPAISKGGPGKRGAFPTSGTKLVDDLASAERRCPRRQGAEQ